MNRAAIMKLIGFIVREMFEHGMELVEALQAEKIEDSALYERMPKQRRMAMLRAKRLLDRQ
jgi:hypothetical protein